MTQPAEESKVAQDRLLELGSAKNEKRNQTKPDQNGRPAGVQGMKSGVRVLLDQPEHRIHPTARQQSLGDLKNFVEHFSDTTLDLVLKLYSLQSYGATSVQCALDCVLKGVNSRRIQHGISDQKGA